jgi:hypothetical protein
MPDMFQEILVLKEVERKLLATDLECRDMDYLWYMTDLFKPYPDIY